MHDRAFTFDCLCCCSSNVSWGWDSISKLHEHNRPSVDMLIRLWALGVPTTLIQNTGWVCAAALKGLRCTGVRFWTRLSQTTTYDHGSKLSTFFLHITYIDRYMVFFIALQLHLLFCPQSVTFHSENAFKINVLIKYLKEKNIRVEWASLKILFLKECDLWSKQNKRLWAKNWNSLVNYQMA